MPSTSLSPISAVEEMLHSQVGIKIVFDPPATDPVDGSFVPWTKSTLAKPIIDTMKSMLPIGLFTHQHAAIEQVLRGHNTVVATQTSSGKSLTFALPAVDAICRDPDATALFLYPQKALANDQHLKLTELVNSISNGWSASLSLASAPILMAAAKVAGNSGWSQVMTTTTKQAAGWPRKWPTLG